MGTGGEGGRGFLQGGVGGRALVKKVAENWVVVVVLMEMEEEAAAVEGTLVEAVEIMYLATVEEGEGVFQCWDISAK